MPHPRIVAHSNSWILPYNLATSAVHTRQLTLMARKAAQKAAKAAPLDGLAIATSGKFPGTTQAALASRIASLGATVPSKVTADTNILIATEKDYESISTKTKAAASHNVPVVTLDWLEECESTGQLLPSTLFTKTQTYW
jgi:poly [ADP-ribose] polymerase